YVHRMVEHRADRCTLPQTELQRLEVFAARCRAIQTARPMRPAASQCREPPQRGQNQQEQVTTTHAFLESSGSAPLLTPGWLFRGCFSWAGELVASPEAASLPVERGLLVWR